MVKMTYVQIKGTDLNILCQSKEDVDALIDMFDIEIKDTKNKVTMSTFVELTSNQRFNLKNFLHIPKLPEELFIPLMFWHTQDVGLAIPYVALPMHSVRLTINFERISNPMAQA